MVGESSFGEAFCAGLVSNCVEVRNSEILLVTQSINGLWRVSQLCPKTTLHVESSEVTRKSMDTFPDEKSRERVTTLSMRDPFDPSIRRS